MRIHFFILIIGLTNVVFSQWEQVNNGLPSLLVTSLAVSSNGSSGTSLFACGARVNMSTDNGMSWTVINTGLPDYPQRAIASNALCWNRNGCVPFHR